jgi:hypothetical protein
MCRVEQTTLANILMAYLSPGPTAPGVQVDSRMHLAAHASLLDMTAQQQGMLREMLGSNASAPATMFSTPDATSQRSPPGKRIQEPETRSSPPAPAEQPLQKEVDYVATNAATNAAAAVATRSSAPLFSEEVPLIKKLADGVQTTVQNVLPKPEGSNDQVGGVPMATIIGGGGVAGGLAGLLFVTMARSSRSKKVCAAPGPL